MRLTPTECTAILNAIQNFSSLDNLNVFLFGSRVHDHLKGGDIDLAIITNNDIQAAELKKVDYRILAALKADPAIGEQKIDLKILTLEESQTPFFTRALVNSISLK